jgi:hypothetical protein
MSMLAEHVDGVIVALTAPLVPVVLAVESGAVTPNPTRTCRSSLPVANVVALVGAARVAHLRPSLPRSTTGPMACRTSQAPQ